MGMNELEQLLTAATAGDLRAFGRVVRRFQDMAYGYAYSLLGDFHLAEDAAQDAFVEAFRSLGKLNELAAFPGWLRRIVQFRCSRVARSRGVAPAPLEAAAGVAADTIDPAEMAERTELSAKVLEAIPALPDRERAVTTLFYINGYTTNDIAAFLEVPTGTVKSRLAASRKRLKERMLAMVDSTLKSHPLPDRFAEVVVQLNFVRERIDPLADRMRELSDEQMAEARDQLRRRLTGGDDRDVVKAKAFALVREATRRAHDRPHYDVQLIAGLMLDDGMAAEMPSGEGKSLTCYPPAYMAALEGFRVHVVTVNDYLATRDAEAARQVFGPLGLTVGHITADMPACGEGAQARRDAYACDVTYGAYAEFAFDCVRDSIRADGERPIQGALDVAIIDEVDSVLVADARTAVIIAEPGVNGEPTRPGPKARPDLKRDRDYVVHDGRVVIVDASTGRLLPERRWADGVHEVIECKEGLAVARPVARKGHIRLADYFGRYGKLAGLTGTAAAHAAALKDLYGLDVSVVPTRQPMCRVDHDDRVLATGQAKSNAVVAEVRHVSRDLGRPVLIGVGGLDECDELSGVLSEAGIEHQVLAPRPESAAREAEIVAAAGQQRPADDGSGAMWGVVTLATPMAGRGTDIRLGDGVIEPVCIVPASAQEDEPYSPGAVKCCIGCCEYDEATCSTSATLGIGVRER